MQIKNLYFLLLMFLFNFKSYAYELIIEKSTVTPGCTGGVLYSKTESFSLETPDLSTSAEEITTE